MHSSVSLTSAVLGGMVAFVLGVVYRATWQAFADLRDTKAKIKGLRRSAWSWAWSLVKHALVVIGILAVLVVWVYRDTDDNGPTPLLPSKSAGPR